MGVVADTAQVIYMNGTLQVSSNGQLWVADINVTKTGDSTIIQGSLIFTSEDTGIEFSGGG